MNSAVSTAPTITFIPWPSKSTALPTQGLVIPKIPIQLPNGLKEDSWQIIVDHRQNRDPSRGLTTLLKDWPDKCKQGKYKAIFAQKHFVRSVIAHEYVSLVYHLSKSHTLGSLALTGVKPISKPRTHVT